MKNNEVFFFFGKIVMLHPLLAFSQWETPNSKLFFGITDSFVTQFSQYLRHLLRLGMQNSDKVIFFLRCLKEK